MRIATKICGVNFSIQGINDSPVISSRLENIASFGGNLEILFYPYSWKILSVEKIPIIEKLKKYQNVSLKITPEEIKKCFLISDRKNVVTEDECGNMYMLKDDANTAESWIRYFNEINNSNDTYRIR